MCEVLTVQKREKRGGRKKGKKILFLINSFIVLIFLVREEIGEIYGRHLWDGVMTKSALVKEEVV